MRKQIGLAVIFLLIGVTALLAHDLFLKLDSFFVPPQTLVRIAVLNGTFATSEAAVAADRLRDLSIAGPAAESRTAIARGAWAPSGDTTWLTLTTGGPGTYVVGASLTPRQIALSAEEFNGYLAEDGIPDVLEARRRRGELTKPARERYEKHVKALLQVGAARTNAFSAVLGYPAEIVPLSNPYDARIGDTLAVRVLVNGQRVANQLVIAGGERNGTPVPEVRTRSDSSGTARFGVSRAGKWYVKFIHMVPVSGDSVTYESKWATLTFEVR